MWRKPYLETCCRSALHRLFLSGEGGRPAEERVGAVFPNFRQPLKDRPCLDRLVQKGFAEQRIDGRFVMTDAGSERHRVEVLSMCRAKKR